MSLEAGGRLDQYLLLARLGEGGMGVVWRARDTVLERDVAIKVLPAAFTESPERRARFEREARLLATLSHPNVVAIHGFGTTGRTSYAVMELLEGATLREHLEGGPLPARKAVEYARQIAAGLDAAHARDIVHRDLKPENVSVGPDGRVRVLDFGLAAPGPAAGKSGAEAPSSELATATGLTDPGTVMGTVGYMAPEQVRGDGADSRSDIFALGVILHEMLAGGRPFTRDTAAETMTAILREDPPELQLGGQPAPPALGRIVRRCLEKSPDERFQNARDLAFALEGATLASGSGPADALEPAGGRRPVRRRLGWPAALAATAAAFAAGWLLRPVPPEAQPPIVTQLTFTGADNSPAASPDGHLIAFSSSRDGRAQIWLRHVNGGEQPLTEGDDTTPVFSPDGSAIAFIRRDGDVTSAFRVPVVGGQPRKLIQNVTEVRWSPDGHRLAFLRGSASQAEVRGTVLGVLDLEKGSERKLAQFASWDLHGLAWSPDGRSIATVKAAIQGGAGSWRMLRIASASGAVEELPIPGSALLSAPAWTKGDLLLYARSDTTVSGSPAPDRIAAWDVSAGRERVLLWEPHLFPLRGSDIQTTRLSVLGDVLLFDAFRREQLVYERDLEGGAERLLRPGISVDRQPAYHPDGSRVLFTSNRSGNVDLFAWERDTGRLLQLTEDPANDWDGAYTPDGESILWGSERSGHLEIWMADADGANPRQVSTDGVAAENPTMTRDGRWIVYSSGNPKQPGLHKVHPDGSGTTLLIGGNWINPEVSPDGRHCLYVSSERARTRNVLRVIEIESGEDVDFEIEIDYGPTAPNVTFGRGRWLPDGSAIVYLGLDAEGRTGLWVQDFEPGVDTSRTRRPVAGFERDRIVESFGIGPDGRRIAVSTIRQVHALKQVEGLGLR